MALACGATVEAAARSAGICERTAYRRFKDPDFQRRIIEMRAEFVTRGSAMLTAAISEFVKTLVALVKESVPFSVRLGAARAGLEQGAKLRENVDQEARIAALEASRLADQRGASTP
jgi:hypothetical protein